MKNGLLEKYVEMRIGKPAPPSTASRNIVLMAFRRHLIADLFAFIAIVRMARDYDKYY